MDSQPALVVDCPHMNTIPTGESCWRHRSIAAHRAVDLASLLVKQGCAVHVVMTAEAQRFVTPLPFKTLSRTR